MEVGSWKYAAQLRAGALATAADAATMAQMLNDRRRLWTSIIFVGLFAPFVALLVLNYLTGTRRGATPAAALPVAPAGRGVPATPPAPAGVADIALQAAGDGRDLWVMQPVLGENKERGFQLLRRSANTGIWRAALRGGADGMGGSPFWTVQTMPRALALMRAPADYPGPSTPYLFGEPKSDIPGTPDPAGWVYRFSLSDYQSQNLLPAGHTIKAATGSVDQLFVLTLGPPVTTQPGDPLRVDRMAHPAAPAVTTTSAPATRLENASAPATTPVATPPALSPLLFNVYWFPPTPPVGTRAASMPANLLHPPHGQWCQLAPLGAPTGDPTAVPQSSSHIAMVERKGRLLVFWADPMNLSVIEMRTLEYPDRQQQWAPPRAVKLGEEVPAESRLFTVTLDKTLYLLWTVPTGSSVALHGGWIDPEAAGDPVLHALSAMSLDAAGTGLTAGEVAVGPSENSIVVVVNNRDEGLKTMTFDSRGLSLGPAVTVVLQSPRRDVQIGQNIAMILVVLMLTLSLWQWRQKPGPLTLPRGTIVAPLHLRGLAFAIDVVLPYAAVLLITGNSSYVGMFTSWLGLLSNPEDLLTATDLFLFLGLYLGHVALGELFFRRSVGKALVGLQVLMLDGKAPTVGAILVRNLVRLPECLVGVVMFYILMSDRRQRLGDLLGKTVVVSQEGPETPEDADKK